MSSFSQINTNIQSQRAFQNLSDTSEELQTRQQRLTTGLRINSASDDAAGFQIANQLEARTGGQQQALRNIGDAKSSLSVAEGALDTQLDILQSAKEKATQAANGSLSQDERDAIANELKEQVAEVNDIAENTTFNGDQLIKGGTSGDDNQSVGVTFQTGATSSNTFDVEIQNSRGRDLGVVETFDPNTESAQTISAGSLTGSTAAAVTSASLSPGDISADTRTTSELAEGLDGGEFDVSVINPSGSNASFQITDSDGNSTTIASASAFSGSSGSATITQGTITLESATTASGTNSITFDASLISISTGQANATGTGDFSSVDSFTVSVDDTGDNIGERLEGSGGDEARNIIDDVDDAIDTLTEQLSNLGASQNRLSFKESNLETSRTNLSAAQSRIEDADFAREQTQVAKLQVQQQSGTAQLAQANAAGQSVLSLLG